MTKKYILNQIQKRLPESIEVGDETLFDFSEDEFIGILSWVKYFNKHFVIFGTEEKMIEDLPVISKRIFLDFNLYRFPTDTENNKGKHVIYIRSTYKSSSSNKSTTIKDLIRVHGL
jgi:hypothetical protein